MSKIKIKNFGPINEGYQENDGWMDIKKVTVFIGNNGTGKSTVNKLISTFTWLEKALYKGYEEKNSVIEEFKDTYCNYFRIWNYFRYNWEPQPKNNEEYQKLMKSQAIPDSEIHFIGSKFEFHYFENELKIYPITDNNEYHVPKIMYVPAERNFISAVENPEKVKGLPSPLYDFLKEFDRSLQELPDSSLDLPIGNLKLHYRKQTKTAHIVGGNNSRIKLSEASSGIQSSVPLFVVSQNLALSVGGELDNSKKTISLELENQIRNEIRQILENDKLSEEFKKTALEELSAKYVIDCFINIVEEPEQNLFPDSQRQMLNRLLQFNNMSEGNKLIMETHSPYIINYLTLAIEANKLKGKVNSTELKNKLENIVPLDSTINSDDVAIYELDENEGIIKLLSNYKGLPSDENKLNQNLGYSNDLFSELLDIEDLCQ